MKLLIAGSRSITDYSEVSGYINQYVKYRTELDYNFPVSEVISGCANGVDKLGEKWAKLHDVPILRYPAQWDLYGKSAGLKRNTTMVEVCDCALVIWDGQSRGTMDTVKKLIESGKHFWLITLKPTEIYPTAIELQLFHNIDPEHESESDTIRRHTITENDPRNTGTYGG